MPMIRHTFDPAQMDVAEIHAFLVTSYWSPGIPESVVRRALAGSLCIAALEGPQLIGFARMVTDRATFAYLADVFVRPPWRGRGVAQEMLERLLAHPDLQGLRRMMLVTRDAHGLYARLGFAPLAAPERFMELHRSDVYSVAPAAAGPRDAA